MSTFKLLCLVICLVSLSLEAQASLRGHLQESFGAIQTATFSMIEERITKQNHNLRQENEKDKAKDNTMTAVNFLTEDQDAACYDCCCDRDVVCGTHGKSAQATCGFTCRAADREDTNICSSRNYACPQYDCDMAEDLW